MGRMVYVDTGFQSVSVAQDLLEVKLGTGQVALVHSVILSQDSEEASSEAEELRVSVKKAAGSFTSGSGGGTATVFTVGPAHGLATVERNNTTQAVVGTGTLEDIPHLCGVFNVLAGEWERTVTPELRVPLAPSEAVIVSVPAPDDAVTMRVVVALEIIVG